MKNTKSFNANSFVSQNENVEENSEFYDAYSSFDEQEEITTKQVVTRRTEIPPKKQNSNLKVLIKILSQSIGKDLTHLPIPATFFSEPISMIQRVSGYLEYSSLLDKAAQCEDSLEQIKYVTAFAISNYCEFDRINKPFNPLLHETFEFDRQEDLGWRTLSEQVSHHPLILASVKF